MFLSKYQLYMFRKPATLLLHLALLIILIGAGVTHFFGRQGEIHLRADKAQTLSVRPSPFSSPKSVSLFLWNFRIICDDLGNPADYVTELRLLDRSNPKANGQQQMAVDEGVVRMNKPLKYKHFRFCQSDYDSDQQGVVLSYNYDPWGIGITYTGYALLLVAMIAFFFQPGTRFRALLKSLAMQWSDRGVAMLFAGLAVFVITMTIVMTKVVTPKPPLQPVLQTPLLGIHVSVIMLAYTLFSIIMITGIVGLSSRKHSAVCSQFSSLLLYPALFCLTAGIFIGAVWANMSWGRYWGWDPKETWALITMMVYALLLHFPWLKRLAAKRSNSATVLQAKPIQQRSGHVVYHIFCIVAFFFVLFTYFGVNRLLGGLHSYAG